MDDHPLLADLNRHLTAIGTPIGLGAKARMHELEGRLTIDVTTWVDGRPLSFGGVKAVEELERLGPSAYAATFLAQARTSFARLGTATP